MLTFPTPIWRRALSRVFRLLVRLLPVPDPWERFDTRAPNRTFGPDAPDWAAVLRAPSDVPVDSLADVLRFLQTCTATSAGAAGDAAPAWPRLQEFEQRQAGDCTGHALWAWRKLIDLGYAPTLVVGRTSPFLPGDARHAWLLFSHEGTELLFETVAKTEDRLLLPLATVRDRYRPEVGVDARGTIFAFGGALLSMRHAAV